MSSVNKVILVGRLGRDPEVRHSSNGMEISSFSLATERKKGGDKVTTWHRCTAFDKTANVVNQYTTKGQMLYVEGSIDHEEYTDKDGAKKTATKILVSNVQLLSSREDGGNRSNRGGNGDPEERYREPAQREQSRPAQRQAAPDNFDSDDIPFSNPYRGSYLYVI